MEALVLVHTSDCSNPLRSFHRVRLAIFTLHKTRTAVYVADNPSFGLDDGYSLASPYLDIYLIREGDFADSLQIWPRSRIVGRETGSLGVIRGQTE